MFLPEEQFSQMERQKKETISSEGEEERTRARHGFMYGKRSIPYTIRAAQISPTNRNLPRLLKYAEERMIYYPIHNNNELSWNIIESEQHSACRGRGKFPQ